jgi:mannosyltransferase
MQQASNHKGWIIAVLLLAALLRFYGLADENLWLDESFSWAQATMSYGDMMGTVMVDVHPPLYFNILFATVNVLGESEFALRLPSVLFGLLTVWMVYLVGLRLKLGRYALAAAFLLAITVFQVRYSQEARMYALTACLSVFSMYAFLGLYRDGIGKRQQVFYVLATALLLYSHVFGLFVVLAQYAYVMLTWLSARMNAQVSFRQWFVLQLCIGLLFLPWVGVLLGQVSRVQGGFWISRPTLYSLWESLQFYAGGNIALLICCAALLCAAALWFWRRTEMAGQPEQPSDVSPLPLLLLWIALPNLIPFAVSLVSQPIYYWRYTIGASPAWYLLVALALAYLARQSGKHSLAIVVVAMIALVQAGPLYTYYTTLSKTRWASVVEYVESQAGSGDAVFIHNYNVIDAYRYYSKRNDLRLETLVAPSAFFAQNPAAGVAVLETDVSSNPMLELADTRERLWLVLAHTAQTEYNTRNVEELLSPEYVMESSEPFGRWVVVQEYRLKDQLL